MKTTTLIESPNLQIQSSEDGVWLMFSTAAGRHSNINLPSFFGRERSMNDETIRQWSEEYARLNPPIQTPTGAYNQALTDAANKVKALSHGLDCSCDGCVARKNDVATILELRIAEPPNDPKLSHGERR